MTIDANVIIAYLAGEDRVVRQLQKMREQRIPLFLSTIAETEILSFAKFTPQELRTTEQFLDENFVTIPFDRTVARIAAEIRRKIKIKTPDAAIAATAIFTDSILLTRNVKDFQKVPNLIVHKV